MLDTRTALIRVVFATHVAQECTRGITGKAATARVRDRASHSQVLATKWCFSSFSTGVTAEDVFQDSQGKVDDKKAATYTLSLKPMALTGTRTRKKCNVCQVTKALVVFCSSLRPR